jgi:phosphonate transport system permease protein
MSRLGDISAADRAGLEHRHAALLRPPLYARLAPALVAGAMAGLAVYAAWRLDVSPVRIVTGWAHLVRLLGLMFPPSAGGQFAAFLHALGETLAIAFLGTMIAAVLAFPLGFLAARNVVPNQLTHHAVRRLLDVIRGVDVLIWALIFINVVGLGPFAGILAIATADIGAFGKLFSEAIENVERGASDGVAAAGGSRLHVVRFGLLPQVVPVMLSQVIYYFESNTRSATIIGIVGAGGIGLQLAEQIRLYEWDKVGVLVAMILVAVAVIDALSRRLRLAAIGPASLPL